MHPRCDLHAGDRPSWAKFKVFYKYEDTRSVPIFSCDFHLAQAVRRACNLAQAVPVYVEPYKEPPTRA